MTFEEFQSTLKNKKFHPNYFLYGSDPFLVQQAAKRLIQALEKEAGCEIQQVNLDLEEQPAEDLLGLCLNLPMFAARQMVQVRGVEKIKDKELERIRQYLENSCSFTTLIFLGGEFDKKDKKDRRTKIYQTFFDGTFAVELTLPKERELKSMIAAKFRTLGMTVESEAIEILLETQGADLGRLSQEIEKLSLLAAEEKRITTELVTESVGFSREHSAFEFLNAVAAKDKLKALEIWQEMESDWQATLGMLSLLARQIRQFLQIKELEGKARSEEIGKIIGVNTPFILTRMINQSKKFSKTALIQALFRLGMVDERIKRSALDTRVFMELLIHDLTR